LRIQILSDLHLEFGSAELAGTDSDVVVLAGDVGVGLRGLEWIKKQWPDRPVVYVPGNHEYYGGALPRTLEKLIAAASGTNVHVLDRAAVEIAGVRFLGATLWTDFDLLGERATAMVVAQRHVTDYKRIRVSPSFRKLSPFDTASLHSRSRRWLEAEIGCGRTRGAVIITHHAPSALSIQSEFASDPLSASYASNLSRLVAESGAALWVHGHTHHCVDYVIGGTRVVSNQRGYVDEPVEGFDPELVLEVNPSHGLR
jgi:hypothetical protein